MSNDKYIFCMQCRLIELRETAPTVFRTGFYKASMPLGICRRCADAERTLAIAELSTTDEALPTVDETATPDTLQA